MCQCRQFFAIALTILSFLKPSCDFIREIYMAQKLIYKINYETFEIDRDSKAMIDEQFTETIADFKQWCVSQDFPN